MTYTGKSDEFYEEKAKKLRSKLRPRVSFTVREAGAILGYSSTAATLNCINRLIERGVVGYEPTGDVKQRYFLRLE